MTELEFEARQIISKEDYERLMHNFSFELYPNHKITEQENVYFDTNDLSIVYHGNVLRLRCFLKENKKPDFTYKVKKGSNDGDLEITQKLNNKEELDLVSKIILPKGEVIEAIQAEGIDVSSIHIVGKIKTSRFEIFKDDYTIVLDKNEYCNVVDYNIEIESSSKKRSEEVLKDILSSFKIKYCPGGPAKSKRAIETFQKKRGI